MFDRSRTRFHDKNWQKSGARFFWRSFESFDKSENRSPMVRKKKYIYIYI